MRHILPHARAGQVIGLLGGSFDPAHEGHAHITRAALKRFGLDEVWWLVSPGNPLKAHGPAEIERRLARARDVMDHPRVRITDFETQAGTRYTAATLKALIKAYPGVTFVWLMGADNLAQFHRWDHWRWIMETVPIGVIARPGASITARVSRAANVYEGARLPSRESRMLAKGRAPRWCYVNVPMSDASSSAIRARGDWAG
ncbi:putative nicotinate-nucleotide adenylyltransferase [Aquimixticola soesokkakensis]|uniref:Probable nicotinate-nucleotide adenylyltransferase n=1 Tax=Aquimixticola soesokkakensis TaxID=1519096 RepID=A0A1Y5TC41_9RHOB|nr:nicotinate-nucleotide adenylyltransferase [Aquimixticola soesokkakensis]SLN60682.1 putative nicotinate-nucleotide adenylyltransferase [Aquimixticola soesokkakensis]